VDLLTVVAGPVVGDVGVQQRVAGVADGGLGQGDRGRFDRRVEET
jgi:hypothetical protein